jgi:hypothetical protein
MEKLLYFGHNFSGSGGVFLPVPELKLLGIVSVSQQILQMTIIFAKKTSNNNLRTLIPAVAPKKISAFEADVEGMLLIRSLKQGRR